jgi:hypothetical protein
MVWCLIKKRDNFTFICPFSEAYQVHKLCKIHFYIILSDHRGSLRLNYKGCEADAEVDQGHCVSWLLTSATSFSI